eukprot:TRINITY_DN1365_c0_g1_i1.p1 TRINITY_DN1365_c0_g1~~TRINITY_DN1365_c0_g1_i1.p1  ORF type:complete len:265 (+),score=74.02 TRINITY_DN1365_c0_g1_i1:24-797(+)
MPDEKDYVEGEIELDDDEGIDEQEQPKEMTKQELLQQRLFDIRLKVNKARASNRQAVMEEYKRTKETRTAAEWMKRKEDLQKKKRSDAQTLEDDSLNPEKEYLTLTAAQAEERGKKRQKKDDNVAPYGWDIFNSDTTFNSYKKRVKRLHAVDGASLKSDYSLKLAAMGKAEFYPDADSLIIHDQQTAAGVNGVQRMVDELNGQQQKRANFHRRRQFWEDKNVDYINERNRVFNEKLSRAFDPYTIEIKQNLERGTAL